ncbi:hypothetical protein [Pseudomonas syringae group sp. J309-1]|uniref:hypothetical protein n=1 Tax=Pseudomonas syringae group sp. J309-1 TaxID=3079588 RepID=UPI00290B61B2|nr:hypothetical protein [Pseudomonas syringae group sp. J309-1]MDU8358419.1 hypothetical protein [Pseudomonas syringae group sp. J309-1]
MKNFIDIDESRKITVSEYLEMVGDFGRRNAIDDMFYMAQATLELMRQTFRTPVAVPDLLVQTTIRVGAEALPWGVIVVTQGMIDHCLNSNWPQANEVLGRDAPYVMGSNLVAQLGLAWVLAHEYTHVFRAHQQVEDELGKEFYVLRALEHDADLCAAGAIYRVIQRMYKEVMDDTAIRRYVVFILFWIIRSLPESNNGAGFHPSFSERLVQINFKLSQMVTLPTDELDDECKLQITRDRADAVRDAIIACEQAYQALHGDTLSGNYFEAWLEYIEKRGHVAIVKDWERVSPYVQRHSGTLADITPKG